MKSNFIELYKFRTLLYALTMRHMSARYRGSILGFLWSLINPLCIMGVYSLVFSFYIRFEVPNYPVFLFCGLLPWIWISSALIEGSHAIVSSGHLIAKSLFPAQILPLVSVLTTLLHFLLSLPILFLFIHFYGVSLTVSMFFLPCLIIVQLFFLYGIILAISSLNVLYRDVQHLTSNALSLLFFLSPIIYPVETVPERFRFTLMINPFSLFIASYHDLLLYNRLPNEMVIAGLVVWSILAVLVGTIVFNRYKYVFAEMF
jgi:lipopolysaccharide transport system permease protein